MTSSTVRPRLVMADGPDGPLPDPATVAALAGFDDPEVILGWIVRTPAWLATTALPGRSPVNQLPAMLRSVQPQGLQSAQV